MYQDRWEKQGIDDTIGNINQMKTVVVGVSSGIAAYKSIELVTLLRKEGLNVFVVMTESAAKMVSPLEFEKASGNKVYTEIFEKDFNYKDILKVRHVDHIDLADSADVVVIVPATANVIAKLAHGIADDFLTTMVLATTAPVLLCPSMNVHMWQNSIVQENIKKLKKLGFYILEPTVGILACGYEGKGRLPETITIKNEITNILSFSTRLKGKKILVTAGGTQEKIDDVRFITNKSSGKMGIAIAQACFLQGAEVLLLRSITSVKPTYPIEEKIFTTTEELSFLLNKYVSEFDILFQVAAVSDFTVNMQRGKISSTKKLTLELKPQAKIIDRIKKINPHIKLIAFKAEYGLSEKNLIKAAGKKLQECSADAVVANDVGKKDRGFGVDTNEVIIVLPDGLSTKIPLNTKQKVAKYIIEFLISNNIL